MSGASKRPLRTLYQSLLGCIAGGSLTLAWNAAVEQHQISPMRTGV